MADDFIGSANCKAIKTIITTDIVIQSSIFKLQSSSCSVMGSDVFAAVGLGAFEREEFCSVDLWLLQALHAKRVTEKKTISL